jgi:hypothetical protein
MERLGPLGLRDLRALSVEMELRDPQERPDLQALSDETEQLDPLGLRDLRALSVAMELRGPREPRVQAPQGRRVRRELRRTRVQQVQLVSRVRA